MVSIFFTRRNTLFLGTSQKERTEWWAYIDGQTRPLLLKSVQTGETGTPWSRVGEPGPT